MPEDVYESRDEVLEVAIFKFLDCYPNFFDEMEHKRQWGDDALTGDWIRTICSKYDQNGDGCFSMF